jgi:uncharacterized protein YxjI
MGTAAGAIDQPAYPSVNAPAQGGARYMLRQKFMAAGQDFYIENMQGQRVMHVDGKALRVRDTLKFKDTNGNVLYQLQERVARVRDTMVIQHAHGGTAATIRHRMVTPVRERFIIELEGGQALEATGRFLYAEYKIEHQGRQVAEVSKRWFRARDMYGIEIGPGIDHNLILACAVCIDMMEHEGRV